MTKEKKVELKPQIEQPEAKIKPISLGELIPTNADFSLSKTGKTYTLRPFDLDDQVWLEENTGHADLQSLFTNFNLSTCCKVIYHQLTQESRVDFKAVVVSGQIDDEGDTIMEQRFSGPEVFRKTVVGQKEMADVVKALVKTIGISQPVLDQLEIQMMKKKEILTSALL